MHFDAVPADLSLDEGELACDPTTCDLPADTPASWTLRSGEHPAAGMARATSLHSIAPRLLEIALDPDDDLRVRVSAAHAAGDLIVSPELDGSWLRADRAPSAGRERYMPSVFEALTASSLTASSWVLDPS